MPTPPSGRAPTGGPDRGRDRDPRSGDRAGTEPPAVLLPARRPEQVERPRTPARPRAASDRSRATVRAAREARCPRGDPDAGEPVPPAMAVAPGVRRARHRATFART